MRYIEGSCRDHPHGGNEEVAEKGNVRMPVDPKTLFHPKGKCAGVSERKKKSHNSKVEKGTSAQATSRTEHKLSRLV